MYLPHPWIRSKKPFSVCRLALICVGDELLRGEVADTHLVAVARALKPYGYEIGEVRFVPDDEAAISTALVDVAATASTIIVTGGLGPTSDDRTREAIARAGGLRLEFSEQAWAQVERAAGRPVGGSNRRQAMVPDGFELLANSRGTAPGLIGTARDTRVIALPGPPAELVAMIERHFPTIFRDNDTQKADSDDQLFSCFGVPESELEDELARLNDESGSRCAWHTRAESGRVVVRVTGENGETLRAGIAGRFGEERVGPGDCELASLVVACLRDCRKRVALAESCTGGLIAKLITDVAGSSDVFWGSAVTYANDAKARILSIDPHLIERYGAVSSEVARAMVTGVAGISGADYTVAVSGIAGPGGGTAKKPVGTVWISWATNAPQGRLVVESRCFSFAGGRDRVRRMTAIEALVTLRQLVCSG